MAQKRGGTFRFPLFVDIAGDPCLVVGAGAVGSRRARVLVSFGADVRVWDPAAASGATDGLAALGCSVESRAWVPGAAVDLAGLRLVVAATADRAVNADIARACREAGVPVSVADSGRESSFFFPAVCEGDRIVAGVVSHGGDHELAAAAARAVRTAIAAVEAGSGDGASVRPAAEAPVGNPVAPGPAAPAQEGACGRVVLVGAGPGAWDLITVRGMHLLEQADVVVHDRLVDESLLAHAGIRTAAGRARLIDVGKSAGEHPVPQREIEDILVAEAHRSHLVVRLKGGDPYVFGRGGEEISRLVAAGLPCEVVPGVTRVLAAPASVGIPATDRRASASVSIYTGHRRDGGELGIDYVAAVAAGGTDVFLMSVASCSEIARGLVAAGMDPATPACMVERGTLPGSRRVDATVGTVGARAREARVKSPALLVVGDVCRFAPDFCPRPR